MKLECLIKQAQMRRNPVWVPSKCAQLAEPGGDVRRGITTVTAALRGPTWDRMGSGHMQQKDTPACRTDSPNTQLVGRNTGRAGETCPSSPVAEMTLVTAIFDPGVLQFFCMVAPCSLPFLPSHQSFPRFSSSVLFLCPTHIFSASPRLLLVMVWGSRAGGFSIFPLVFKSPFKILVPGSPDANLILY